MCVLGAVAHSPLETPQGMISWLRDGENPQLSLVLKLAPAVGVETVRGSSIGSRAPPKMKLSAPLTGVSGALKPLR